MFSIQFLGMVDLKCPLHILLSFLATEQCLLIRIAATRQMVQRIDRNTGLPTQSASNPLTLVVSSLPFPPRMQRNRHNKVDFIEEIRTHKLHRCLLGQILRQVGTIGELDGMNQSARYQLIVKKKKRRSTPEATILVKQLFGDISTQCCLLGTGQCYQTVRTQHFARFHRGFACRTKPWIQHIRQTGEQLRA